MEWEIIADLIDPRLPLVVGACWAVGYMLKRTPKIPDWTIVYIVVVLAVVFACGLLGWSTESVVQGILAGAFSVFGHQAAKQACRCTDGRR